MTCLTSVGINDVGVDVGFNDVGVDIGFDVTGGSDGTPAQSLAILISAQFQN